MAVIIYLVVGLSGLMFFAFSLTGLHQKPK
jgi:hypothetical protein